jgi:transcriptional regulator GlxA family with amidase domain
MKFYLLPLAGLELALLAGCSAPSTQKPAEAALQTSASSPLPQALPARSLAPKTALNAPVKVAILVYPDVELLDFSRPAEVLSSTRDVQVYLVSTQDKAVATNHNVVHLTADYTLADTPQPDILVVPGGSGEVVAGVYRDPAVVAWIKKVDHGTQLTMSVCTGAFILSQTGLTHHKRITSHWSALDSLQRFDPKATVLKDKRFV